MAIETFDTYSNTFDNAMYLYMRIYTIFVRNKLTCYIYKLKLYEHKMDFTCKLF